MRKRTILVVEDNADGLVSLQLMLECWGYRVEVARDGLQGLEKSITLAPDVVLSDIGLPKLDGYELARRVRLARGENVLLIALTGYTDVRRSLEAGFDIHLIKPVDPEELAGVLRGSRHGRSRTPVPV